ncbi:hypothetical protein [Miniphocaeibacter halophilus]|uniref:Uncharacterized protein n=1 Tax=Miniphocaeibacter halophilus TaxID=2931922 RepID=A0AC61MRM8_9FIRM|nr:hypothetical protein [Miniphocaeibacter halophilus]QQK07529.1 hypothetical protein JFY71_09545 [Miniphocaeibacter halophilus]
MNYLQDFLYVQKTAIKNTFKGIRYFFIVAIAIIASSLVINIVSNILNSIFGFGMFSIIIDLLIYILEIFIISFIMNILFKAVKTNGKGKGFIQDSSSQFMYKIIQIAFIFYLVRLILQIGGLYRIYNFLIPVLLIVFNALPESIYLENYDSQGTLIHSLEFLKNNIINWGLPNLLFFGVLWLLDLPYILPFNISFTKNILDILISLLIVLIYSIFLIYRGNLFEILNGSSMRKRDYMRKFN